jgi:hypothetical protein
MGPDGIPLAPNRTLEVRRSSQTGGDSLLAHRLDSTPVVGPTVPGERITRFESRAARGSLCVRRRTQGQRLEQLPRGG